MLKLNLQFFGGRGSSSGGGGNLGGGKGGLDPANIKSETDVWTYRHNPNNAPYVDAINAGVDKIQNDFPGLMDDITQINTAELSGTAKNQVLGFYGSGRVALNSNFTDIDKMNAVYDNSVKSGYHPSRGNLTGTEAVALHETGHALTDHIGKKMGYNDIDSSAKAIVDEAYKNSGGKGGTKKFASKISKYATDSNAECIAEAVADFYCNGSKAQAESKAIMGVLNKYK